MGVHKRRTENKDVQMQPTMQQVPIESPLVVSPQLIEAPIAPPPPTYTVVAQAGESLVTPPKVLVGSFSDLAGGICECFHDGCFSGCRTYCCTVPCISIGTVAEAADGTGCSKMMLFACCTAGTCHPCVHASCTLSVLREKHGMQPDCFRDCCCHLFCGECARAQELRFVDAVRKLEL